MYKNWSKHEPLPSKILVEVDQWSIDTNLCQDLVHLCHIWPNVLSRSWWSVGKWLKITSFDRHRRRQVSLRHVQSSEESWNVRNPGFRLKYWVLTSSVGLSPMSPNFRLRPPVAAAAVAPPSSSVSLDDDSAVRANLSFDSCNSCAIKKIFH